MFANRTAENHAVATHNAAPEPHSLQGQIAAGLPALLIVAGFLARLLSARAKFLNADEAMHYLLSLQPSFAATHQASLGTAHPPLLIILLHYWGMIASSELFLRLPSLVAGTAAGWFLYAWLRDVFDRETALLALALFLFSPALIYTSAEVRQYALLLCFASAALYLLERSLILNSPALMLSAAISLYLALVTHYSALIFAVSIAAYALLRIASRKPKTAVVITWAAAQTGCVALVMWLWRSHIAVIRHRSLTQDVAESYLRGSLFHAGEENVLVFLARANVRVFHFLFSEGAVAAIALALFIAGIVILLRSKTGAPSPRPKPRDLGILLLLPFVINCAAAIFDVYPYGGTRHNGYLAIFAMPAVAVALVHWKPNWTWTKPLTIAGALAISNFNVIPAGAYIKPSNQDKSFMRQAVQYLRTSAPAGSTILTDYESSLLLSYYVCHKDITHPGAPNGSFYYSQCGEYQTASLLPRLWVFRQQTFPEQISELAASAPADRQIWLFQAGFIVDREPEFQQLLSRYGCGAPERFGANILACQLWLPPIKN